MGISGGALDPFDFNLSKAQHLDLYHSGQLSVHLHAAQLEATHRDTDSPASGDVKGCHGKQAGGEDGGSELGGMNESGVMNGVKEAEMINSDLLKSSSSSSRDDVMSDETKLKTIFYQWYLRPPQAH